MSGRIECVGIGKMFGHKWYGAITGIMTNHCTRCGMPKGGWPAPSKVDIRGVDPGGAEVMRAIQKHVRRNGGRGLS